MNPLGPIDSSSYEDQLKWQERNLKNEKALSDSKPFDIKSSDPKATPSESKKSPSLFALASSSTKKSQGNDLEKAVDEEEVSDTADTFFEEIDDIIVNEERSEEKDQRVQKREEKEKEAKRMREFEI